MRIIFMGSPGFAVPSLEALAGAGHDIVAAYCQPPRPAGRGKAERKTAVHLAAEALGITIRTPRSLRTPEAQGEYAALDADLAVVAAYGLILPKVIIETPKAGCVNVHASLLPRWRGAAPIQRAILAGDDVTGVTIMRMDEGLDTGPMLHRRELVIGSKNAGQVTDELAKIGAAALLEWIEHPTPPEAQPEVGATYAAKIGKSETRIDWSQPAEQVARQVRAFAPAPGAWFVVNGERVKLLEAKVEPPTRHPRGSAGPASLEPAESDKRHSRIRGNGGVVVDEHLLIACGTGAIRPLKVQRAGRSVMSPEELLRGFPISVGTILS